MYHITDNRFCQFDYNQWVKYFKWNARHRLETDFSEEGELSPEIRRLITPSLTAFQKGEQSEGTFLRRAAEEFSADQREPSYPEAIKWFIREENMHSAYLAQYMKKHDIKKRKSNFLDVLFRRLRQQKGIYSEVTVLVTAEIIALSYYTALGNAVSSQALKRICCQMLHDELPHVIFQSYTLSHFKKGVRDTSGRIFLMEISCVAVWAVYGNVFRSGGYSFHRFRSDSLKYLRQSLDLSETMRRKKIYQN